MDREAPAVIEVAAARGPVATPEVSVVVPVYGDGAALEPLVGRVAEVFDSMPRSCEIILVNDGSPSDVWPLIERLTRAHANVRGINLARNFGQHNALLAGIRASRGDVIVTMDDDLQHPPEEIPRVLEALEAHLDVVYGTPLSPPHKPWRNVTSLLVKAGIKSVLGARMARDISAFRAFRGGVRQSFADFRSPDVSIDVLLNWATNRVSSIKVRHEPRRLGRSHYTVWRLLAHTMNMVTGFSVWPLRLASLIGFAFTCFGVAVLVFVVGRYLVSGGSVAGFPFLASIVALFSGAQLFALGIIGEYLARMYFRLLDRPPYVVQSTANFPKP